MPRDRIYYLDPTQDEGLRRASSALYEALRSSSQPSAPATQWLGFVRGLTGKGVRQAEIDDSGVIPFLEQQGSQRLNKDELLSYLQDRLVRIKVVDLSRPKFSGWVSLNGDYQERLYVLSSEAMHIDDLMEDLFYRMEEIGFNPSILMEDPDIVDRMEQEMTELKARRPRSWDFDHHHFSEVVREHGKNLLAHARFVRQGDLFFIQEVQSDWAQRGRRHNWSGNYPKAPFVTQTESWASLVLKDLLQEAARDERIQRVAWIRADMRNGWDRDQGDGLQEFYDNIVRRLVRKLLEKTDASVQTISVQDKRGQTKEVLGFEMTPSAREKLSRSFHLYSYDHLLRVPRTPSEEDEVRRAVLRECESMLGSAHMVRFFNRLYDAAEGREVAGRYWKETVAISLRASDPISVARHEVLHFAYDQLLLPHERMTLDMAFFPCSELNTRVRDLLMNDGRLNAAREAARNPKEAAAYGFEYWAKGMLQVQEQPRGVFERVFHALIEMGQWLRRWLRPHEKQNTEEIFEAVKSGFAARRQQALMALQAHEQDEWSRPGMRQDTFVS
ncbi:MAG: hypothetical protein N2690_01595 [Rhodocyclaceae bacterium]|nr:hypothetical protein [Rhodocyclaceae bacterium]